MKIRQSVFTGLSLGALALGLGLGLASPAQARQAAPLPKEGQTARSGWAGQGAGLGSGSGAHRPDPSHVNVGHAGAVTAAEKRRGVLAAAKPVAGKVAPAGEKPVRHLQAKGVVTTPLGVEPAGPQRSVGPAGAAAGKVSEKHRAAPVFGLGVPSRQGQVAPHHGPAPASLSGLAFSTGRNVGVLNGTQMTPSRVLK